MPPSFAIRRATVSDADTIARHRVAMFRDMERLGPEAAEPLHRACREWLAGALARGEYLGWLASALQEPTTVVAGAGVQRRRVLPFPQRLGDGSTAVAPGDQAIVVNVYTEPAYRRRGVARQLMEAVLAWAASVPLDSLVLHAADDGRPLYESMGFHQTNEMRYGRILSRNEVP